MAGRSHGAPLRSEVPLVSLVIATRDRNEELVTTVGMLGGAADGLEIIIVDDGSSRPVAFPGARVLRTPGLGRSEARNLGAREAAGDLLAFLDDDMTVSPGFLAAHLDAHQRRADDLLAVGANRLPASVVLTPFGRFRQQLEDAGLPESASPVPPNFCSAANMSMSRSRFLALGGFAADLQEAEDQDLALRHSSAGGRIVFLPTAQAVHRDSANDIRSYCERVERGARGVVRFCRRHPHWPDNVERVRVNGPVTVGREPLGFTARKLFKASLGLSPLRTALFAAIRVLELRAPEHAALDRLYRLAIGIHVQRGFRSGLAA
jgi:GT2 family glycosyltransferase